MVTRLRRFLIEGVRTECPSGVGLTRWLLTPDSNFFDAWHGTPARYQRINVQLPYEILV